MRYFSLLLCLLPLAGIAQKKEFASFAEIGTTLHGGDHTPLWQNALQHGLSSVDNNGYLRAGVFVSDSLGHGWTWASGLDLAGTVGMDAHFFVQQAYADLSWGCLDLSVGSKELTSRLLNPELSSGDLVWSGNARPIPQVRIGIFDYTPVFSSSWLAIRGEIAYGWWTDANYLETASTAHLPEGEPPRWYTKKIKYHHKEFNLRIGKPAARWELEVAYRLDNQFGGYIMHHPNKTWFPNEMDLGNGLKNYWNAFIPGKGDGGGGLEGEKIAREGNFLGSEMFRLNYKGNGYRLSAYMQNFFDDFSGMGKLNGFDGLWGLEYASSNPRSFLKGVLFEYYQTTHQSGSLHGSDAADGEKTGGADDYYNNYLYQGWTHWGQGMANPLIPSPAYFSDQIVRSIWGVASLDSPDTGYMGFPYNRVRAFHVGAYGCIAPRWDYRVKCSVSRTWGTPFCPTLEPLDNCSGFVEARYRPSFCRDMQIVSSLSFDSGEIYGDNFGWQLKIRKAF